MRYAKFEVTDKAIGVCAIDYKPIHKQLCLAYGSDLFCRECMQEMFNLALEHGLVVVHGNVFSRQHFGQVVCDREENDQREKARPCFVCGVCGESFGSQQALAGHMKKH